MQNMYFGPNFVGASDPFWGREGMGEGIEWRDRGMRHSD